MTNPTNSPRTTLLERLLGILKLLAPNPISLPATGQQIPNNSLIEPARILPVRVLLVVFDPVLDPASGTRLSRSMQWQRPNDLAAAFIQDIQQVSGGLARYQIVQRIEIDEFPAKIDGFRYDPQSYQNVLKGSQAPRKPAEADYQAILARLNILPRIARREIDEVWFFAFPHAGFYESIMGGAGAFWCNSQPLKWTGNCTRRFILMGFSYERGVGEMLEFFGHRAESLVARVFNCQEFVAWAYRQGRVPASASTSLNPFQKYLCFDQIAPGRAGVGTIHFAPNSEKDYDWGNPRLVSSNCHDWSSYPRLQDAYQQVNAEEWGNGDIRLHHKWWLEHLPKVGGRTNGIANNWWQYIMDPNLVNL